MRVAIVGSGPSGFFAADALFRADDQVRVDMFERLPVPFGLVRHGVAPDQVKIKSVCKAFERIAARHHFGFFGNVAIGQDVAVAELQRFYDAVILAVGAVEPRRLGIAGEELPGSHTSMEFVGWYNGHPDYADASFDLSHERAVVIGNGNVALDVARVLAKGAPGLGHTDIPRYAIEALRESKVREVQIIGRRGPVQARFTINELKELLKLDHCQTYISPEDRALSPACRQELEEGDGLLKRTFETLMGCGDAWDDGAEKHVHMRFHESPVRFAGDGRVERVVVERNRLVGPPGKQQAEGTGELVEIPAGLVVTCVGYRGKAIVGVPFDDRRGVIPNTEGRVTGEGPQPTGIYVVGWIKHMARGIIGDTKADSAATVRSMMEDWSSGSLTPCEVPDDDGVVRLLKGKGCEEVPFEDWARLDAEELARGKEAGKAREKFTHIPDMLSFCKNS